MASDLQTVVQLLEASLDPKQHKQAEAALQAQEESPGFSLKLLQIVASETYPHNSRLASALCFKNFIRRTWTDEDGNYKLPENEVLSIKRELVGLMITVPPAIQAQLGDAVSVIAESDFYERWDYLVDDLVSRLTPDDAKINNGVLQVAHSIFRRWRPLYRSDALFTEIQHVLAKFGTPFLTLLQNTERSIDQHNNSQDLLKKDFGTLDLCLKLFYDLNCQDIPEIFEDNIQGVSELLMKYLSYDNSLLHSDDDSEAGPQELVKTAILDILILFTQKYEDVFGSYINPFVQASWNLLTTVGPETKNDLLVSRALAFLTSVTRISKYAATFKDEAVLGQVVEGVILPNIALRESDIEVFEDEPNEFARRDLEGTDSDTRRRAATDFLRELMRQFDELVSRVVMQYIQKYIQDYSTSSGQNWKAKDTANYLFNAIAAKGVVTTAQGVKEINPHVNVIEYFQKNVAADLLNDSSHVLLQVDAIKFLYMFRSQLTPQQWQEVLPMVVKHLSSSNYVVHTYCAIAIERVLALSTDTGKPVVSRADLAPASQELLKRLFMLITKSSAPEKVQENEFLARCVMRVVIVLKEDMLPVADFLLTSFVTILNVIRHNPSNPRFYYYLFEAMGAFIKAVAPSQPEKLESALYRPFGEVLSNDVQEFMPYVFQLFAALLEANPSGPLPEMYKSLVGPILSHSLWEARGNVPALARLLCSIILRDADSIIKNNQIEPVLGIFQKLIAAKSSESQGFELLETVITSLPPTALQPYFVEIFRLILLRLQTSKTENFTIRFVRLYYFIADRDDKGLGADFVSNVLDQVQQGVYTQLYVGIILPNTQKLVRPYDRKIAAMALTKTLADSTAFAEKYARGWGFSADAYVKLMKDPPLPLAAAADTQEADVDDLSFGVGFTQLSTCKKPVVDPHPEVTDLVAWCTDYLRAADKRHSGRLTTFVQQRCTGDVQAVLGAALA